MARAGFDHKNALCYIHKASKEVGCGSPMHGGVKPHPQGMRLFCSWPQFWRPGWEGVSPAGLASAVPGLPHPFGLPPNVEVGRQL